MSLFILALLYTAVNFLHRTPEQDFMLSANELVETPE
jgi:hypothetical protein